MTNVILDTNVLLLFGQKGMDVFAEIGRAMQERYEFTVPELVLAELERLGKKASRDGRAAKLAYTLVHERLKMKHEPLVAKLLFRKEIPLKTVPCSEHHADDAILRIAEGDAAHTIVATLDKGLQRRLLDKGVRILTVRQQGFKILKR